MFCTLCSAKMACTETRRVDGITRRRWACACDAVGWTTEMWDIMPRKKDRPGRPVVKKQQIAPKTPPKPKVVKSKKPSKSKETVPSLYDDSDDYSSSVDFSELGIDIGGQDRF